MCAAKNRDQHTSVEDFATFEMFLMDRVDLVQSTLIDSIEPVSMYSNISNI